MHQMLLAGAKIAMIDGACDVRIHVKLLITVMLKHDLNDYVEGITLAKVRVKLKKQATWMDCNRTAI